jgi:SAM-dependent methyltransferase
MDTAQGYSLAQLLGLPTVQRYRHFVRTYVPRSPDRRVLEIGCGVGSSRPLFAGDYTGVDLNPDYIAKAQRQLSGRFYVMDAAELPFAPNSFVDAILPLSPQASFKRALFQMDRGRFIRTFDQLCDVVSRNARIECRDAVRGPLHDVCYIRASPLGAKDVS